MNATHETTRAWSDIPFFRKPWGSFFPLVMCWPLYIIIMWSGEFYYRKKGTVRTRGLAFKIILTVVALIVGSFFVQVSTLEQHLSRPRTAGLELPACTSEAVKRLASQTLSAASDSLLSFEAKAAAYDPQLEIRTCSFTAITTLERHEGFFTVRWTDKANGVLFLEM